MIAPLTCLVLTLADAALAPAPPARSAQAILSDFVTAIGGAKALQRHKSMRMKRAVTVTGMGIEGTEERWGAAGNKFLVVMTMPGLATARQGSDGKVFWSEDPINGKRLQDGAEREQARLAAHWNAELNLDKLYKKITPIPAPKTAPKTALECLEMTPAVGPAITYCFDAVTHLQVYQAGRQVGPQGEIPAEALFSEWRTYDGVKLPTVERTTAGPTSFESRVTEVKFDETFAPDLFQLKPAAKASAKATKPATQQE
jgi:hypothetical protein